jgi:hypothetical protein
VKQLERLDKKRLKGEVFLEGREVKRRKDLLFDKMIGMEGE